MGNYTYKAKTKIQESGEIPIIIEILNSEKAYVNKLLKENNLNKKNVDLFLKIIEKKYQVKNKKEMSNFLYNCYKTECASFLYDSSNFKTSWIHLEEILSNLQQPKNNESYLIEQLVKNDLKFRIYEYKQKNKNIINENTKSDIKNRITKSYKQSLNSWKKGKNINRETGIKICLTLHLDLATSNKFLNQACRTNGFNIKNANDNIYIYCLINKMNLLDTKQIQDEYSNIIKTLNSTETKYERSGHTTYLLNSNINNIKDLAKSDFIYNYMLPNASKFIGYSNTAYKWYLYLKIKLIILIINEWMDYFLFSRVENDKNNVLDKFYKNIKVTDLYANSNYNIDNKIIAKYEILQDSLCKLDKNNFVLEINEIWKDLYSIIKEYNIKLSLELLNNLNNVLTKIVPNDKLLENNLPNVYKNNINGKQKIISINKYQNKYPLLRDFPIKQYFSKFESNPKEIFNSPRTKKIICMLFYWMYMHEWEYSEYNLDNNYSNFVEKLNNILEQCQLPTLYPVDQFDWIILKSIAVYEQCVDNEYIEEFKLLEDYILNLIKEDENN